MDQRQPSKEEYILWRDSEVTRYFINQLVRRRLSLIEAWAEGQCETGREEHTIQGRAQALKDILEYVLRDFEYYQEPEENSD